MKVKGIILSVFLSLIALVIMPFSVSKPVHANSIQFASPFLGVNYYVFDRENAYSYSIGGTPTIEQTNFESFYCANFYQGACTMYQHRSNATNQQYNEYEIDFNNTYIQAYGTSIVDYVYQLEFILDNDYVGYFRFSVTYQAGGTYTYRLFVNGNSISQTVEGVITSISITDVQLTKISNGYWTFPVESFTNVVDMFNKGFEQVGFNTYNDYMYPIFKEDSTKYIANTQTPNNVVVSFYTTRYIWNETEFNRYFSYNTSDFDIGTFNVIQRSPAGYIVTIVFNNKNGNTAYLNMKSLNSSGNFTVFYNRVAADVYPISTDFALQFGLQNDLLNNLNIIANGNNNTDSSASDLENLTDDFSQTSDDVINVENNIGSGFENSLQDIPTSFNFSNQFGASFIRSAQWVRDQFNTMTLNNPFGSLITFSLILGVGLLLLGRKLL